MSGLDMALGDAIATRKKFAPKPRAKPAAKGARGGKGGAGSATKAARAPAPYKGAGGAGKKVFGLANSPGGAGAKPVKNGADVAVRVGGRLSGRLGKNGAAGPSGTKILVGNLAADITTADIKELFETVGEVLTGRVFGKTCKAEVVFAQQSKAMEAIKQFHLRTLDGVPMDVKMAPFEAAAQADAASQGKAAMFGTALGGGKGNGGGKGAGRQAPVVETKFSIVLPKAVANGKGAGKGAGKGEKGAAAGKGKGKGAAKETAKDPEALDKEMDDYFNKKTKASKREKKEPAAKEAPPSSEDLDGEMDAYFAARNAPAAEAAAE